MVFIKMQEEWGWTVNGAGCGNGLPREVRKLASAIEEKDNQIQAHEQKILRLNEEIDDSIRNRLVGRRGSFDNVLYFIKKNSKD